MYSAVAVLGVSVSKMIIARMSKVGARQHALPQHVLLLCPTPTLRSVATSSC